MPGWHVTTQDWRQDGRLETFGIAVEQHPDRTRLFMQATEMDWPVAWDPFNLYALPLVPVTLAVDELGVVRLIQPALDDPDRFEREFLDQDFGAPEAVSEPVDATRPDLDAARAEAKADGARAWHRLAVDLTLWGEDEDLDDAVSAARRAVELDDSGETRFTLGVVLRRRFDSSGRRDGDLVQAVEAWTAALDADPNNYIRRRRLQQYGPKLAKPYPFYDWVEQARETIEARGEEPVALVAEPGGTELLAPSDAFTVDAGGDEPDPDGRIHADEGLIRAERAVVPPAVTAGDAARVHLVFEPTGDAHWNNEMDGLEVWIDPPDGWQVDQRRIVLDNPPEPTSDEPRVVEVEVRAPTDVPASRATAHAYALYYVCEDADGVCLYRRQDIPVELEVVDEARRSLADRSLRT